MRYCRGPTESKTSEPWPENIAYDSSAKLAASVAPTSALIGLRPMPMREKGWSREFVDPIDLPHGRQLDRQLVTLEDAETTSPSFRKLNIPLRNGGMRWKP